LGGTAPITILTQRSVAFQGVRSDVGYVFGFDNSVTGPVLTPGGALAENVTLKSSGNAFQLAFALGTRGF